MWLTTSASPFLRFDAALKALDVRFRLCPRPPAITIGVTYKRRVGIGNTSTGKEGEQIDQSIYDLLAL